MAAKVAIKNQTLTSFGEIYYIEDEYTRLFSELIDHCHQVSASSSECYPYVLLIAGGLPVGFRKVLVRRMASAFRISFEGGVLLFPEFLSVDSYLAFKLKSMILKWF